MTAAEPLLHVFRTLTSFSPPRGSLASAPWEAYVDWAIAQGLGPLSAYNLEYRLAGADAPEWARDRLLSVYQGSLNDNVMKLVQFKRALDDLEGRKVILWGGASFADALYPHVAFRPVLEVRLLVSSDDAAAVEAHLLSAQLRPEKSAAAGPVRILSDGRTQVWLVSRMLPQGGDRALFERALPWRVYGSSGYRLELEDALLVHVLELARAGFDVPWIELVDLRELLLGAPSLGGPYSRAPNLDVVFSRARSLRLDRALYVAGRIVEQLFPDAAAPARALQPTLSSTTRRLLERWVVSPVTELGKLRVARGAERLRKLLAGGS
jgi:hypothetical protein